MWIEGPPSPDDSAMVVGASKNCSMVSSVESSRLAPAVPRCTVSSATMRSDHPHIADGFTPDGLYDSRWDLYRFSAIQVSTADTYSWVCLRNFTHVFFVEVVSVLEVHSRPVLQRRDSIR